LARGHPSGVTGLNRKVGVHAAVHDERVPDWEVVALEDAVKIPLVALDEPLKIGAHANFAEKLQGLCVPTLIVGGTDDPMMTPDALKQGVIATLPNSRLVLLDCNHSIPIEKPQEVAALVQAVAVGLWQNNQC
jgi:pimeloyl-ACP methyl ester carboxylesterase